MDYRNALNEVLSKLTELEGEARKLQNQNLADIVGSARIYVDRAAGHPDVDNVGRDEPAPPVVDPLNSGGNLAFAAGDPGVKLQAEEAARRAAFDHDAANRNPVTGQPLAPPAPDAAWTPPPAPFTPPPPQPFPGADSNTGGKPDVTRPGAPEFQPENNNPGFTKPNDVDLNPGTGTLRDAPNSIGAREDEGKR